MPVDLKKIPPPDSPPSRIVWWFWFLLLIIFMISGVVYVILTEVDKPIINDRFFWERSLVTPVISWLLMFGTRVAIYQGRKSVVEKRNKDREYILEREIKRGRRSFKLLGVSIHTALRGLDDTEGLLQSDALNNKTRALKTQSSWRSDDGVKHSQLQRMANETPDDVLKRTMNKTLDELGPILTSADEHQPLLLLLENNTSLPDNQVTEICEYCFKQSQIRQPLVYLEGNGLSVIDKLLDQQLHKDYLLMIISFQLIPEELEGTAEAMAGLLLEYPGGASGLTPLATLYRPQRASGTGSEDLRDALQQSMFWGDINPQNMKAGWLVGSSEHWNLAIASGLEKLKVPINIGRDLYNIDSILGFPGPVSPWLAISCAVTDSKEKEPRIIISGDLRNDNPLWVTTLLNHDH
ncbi:hypothetical protein [uncultured Pluralibacter sp.]|uniref:hypothetical protein n=1 Tax=uncultured Pluralibacter sp. TaxID=1490864 RepID=UPI002628A0A0|nr:hypothetical protein [uncultured Pluralibacter sp.]